MSGKITIPDSEKHAQPSGENRQKPTETAKNCLIFDAKRTARSGCRHGARLNYFRLFSQVLFLFL